MAIINIQTPENATGKVKDFYDELLKIMPLIPKPVQLSSASSTYFSNYTQRLKYFFAHPTLSQILQAHIRMIVAFKTDYPYCVDRNIENLKALGLSDEQVTSACNNPDWANLCCKDRAMLRFVVIAVSTPESIESQDIDTLRRMGWNDPDIFDATSLGVDIVAMGLLSKIFKMNET